MRGAGKYILAALLIAAGAHFAFIYATPRVLMNVAIERLSEGGTNAWRLAPRVTPQSRTIVRPSPDFAYSTCAYDLSRGPLLLRSAAWSQYWSLSLYAANSDNFFVIDDREARHGANIVLVRGNAPDTDLQVVRSPSTRGIALIRRLAPTADAHRRAQDAAQSDVCAPFAAQ